MQASTEWTQVNEAKRLLVLGEAATVQETCSAKQQLQQDGSETQDAHTTGSPVPAGLTTPPAQLLQQPACSSVPAPVSHTTAQAMGRLFQPTHTDSVLDVKVGGWVGWQWHWVLGILLSASDSHSAACQDFLSLPVFTVGHKCYDHHLPRPHNAHVRHFGE